MFDIIILCLIEFDFKIYF